MSPHKTRQSPRLAQRATKSPEPEQSPTRGSPTKASASARGRGRPRKEDSPAKIPAKRGRPPKNAPYKDTGEEGDETSEEEQPDSRRSPGKASAKRNKKATAEDDLDVHPTVEAHSPVRRSPGKSPAKPAHRVTKGTRSVSPVKATRASPAKSSAPTRRSPSKSPAKTTRGARSVSPVKATRRSPSKSSGKKAAHPAEDEDVEMMDVDELALASPKRAAAGYKTTSPGKSHQSPKSKQATWQQREKSPAKSPAKTAKASTKADKEKATAAVPAPPSAARGPIESSTNPENLPDGGKNPFHHTMPGPEVWHRRMPPYFSFGETPYMERILSAEINKDLSRGK